MSKQVIKIRIIDYVHADSTIIVMPNMDRRRRSSVGEEEVKGPGMSLEEWREEKRRLEVEREEEKRKARLDSQMSFTIDGGPILDIQR